ncbi:MAG: spermine synthase [Aequorivita sp.]|nr:spermine synthase [Aequorivita sp.]
MKKILSYIWPTTQRYTSTYNNTLEVTYIDGKKLLDTQNANYSYGSLQKILEFGISKIDIQNTKNILLLGLGGGSVIKSLREKFKYRKNIVAVEIDPQVIKLAKEEFEITASEKLQIIQDDAFQYIKKTKKEFQLIIVDLFIDTKVPAVFYEEEFCKNLKKLIEVNGYLIFNAGIELGKNSKITTRIIKNFGSGMEFTVFKKVNSTNTLLIALKTEG